jgi:hypothetical protein
MPRRHMGSGGTAPCILNIGTTERESNLDTCGVKKLGDVGRMVNRSTYSSSI